MYPVNEAARARIDQDIHRAEAYRLSRQTARGRAEAHHQRARVVARTFAAAILWPVKH